jgi:hypothetical protein
VFRQGWHFFVSLSISPEVIALGWHLVLATNALRAQPLLFLSQLYPLLPPSIPHLFYLYSTFYPILILTPSSFLSYFSSSPLSSPHLQTVLLLAYVIVEVKFLRNSILFGREEEMKEEGQD